jgi:spectinomycin phosphotransferase
MREKPILQEERIIARLQLVYGLEVVLVDFLPLGADYDSAVYRVVTKESVPYFLKLRKDNFEETSLVVPQFLHEQGIRQVIPPRKTKVGHLWTKLEAYTCILYPFIPGRDGFKAALSNEQWIEFGAALNSIHRLNLPPDLQSRIPSDHFIPFWRDRVKGFQEQVEGTHYSDPVAAEMAVFMRAHRDEISRLVERAEQLAFTLQSKPLERVLCHSDIHAGNLLLVEDGGLYFVDWDNPILAPKERDLMFIGGGVGGIWNSAREADLFYQGYGSTEINLAVLAYYRFERIVQDIAAFCEEILLTTEGGTDREQGLRYFTSQFLPGSVIEIAYQTDHKLT